jgi:DNA-3-methyladenine glycosylase II
MTWNIDTGYKTLRKDPVMKSIIKSTGRIHPEASGNLYKALLTSIVSQQLSVKAADTIWGRVQNLFPNKNPKPELILKMDIELLRGAGLSYQKAGYMKNIAQFSIEKSLDYRKLRKLTNEELIAYLTEIKGVGRWTVEMILMFALNRPDVLPLDDLGIQHGFHQFYGLKTTGKKMHAEMEVIALQWAPYRSLACRHLWMAKDANG